MNILQRIGEDYSFFAICLLNDEDGGELETIKASNNKVKPIVQEIFNELMKGDHDYSSLHARIFTIISLKTVCNFR